MQDRIKASELMVMTPLQVIEDERVQGRFIKIFNGITKGSFGENMYIREKEWFLRLISESELLQKCTPVSIFSAFMDIATLGLSVAKGTKPLAYLIPYRFNKGTPKEEVRMSLEVSPYGELAMRKTFGQVADVDNPKLVYEGDIFRVFESKGHNLVEYEKKEAEGGGRRLKAGFIKIVKPEGSIEYFTMDMNDIERLRKYSEKKNGKVSDGGKGANKLYTSNNGQVDEGFFIAKIIKHAFNAYPKAPYMQHVKAVLQTEKEDPDIVNLSNIDEDEPQKNHPVEDVEAAIVDNNTNPADTSDTTDINPDNIESY